MAGKGASLQNGWEIARQAYEDDAIIEASVAGFNKGGLLLEWRGLPGFVPASQLLDMPRLHVEQERLSRLKERQGEMLRLKIIELDEESNKLILSERATRVSAAEQERLLRELAPGERRRGVVTNLADFGAFVDLGGVEGLIHISQLSWRRLLHPADVVRPGQEIDVLVLEVDQEDGRVALSRKRLFDDPWPTVEERYEVGQIVEGVVSNLVSFGAFILVERELEGLIHVSELTEAACDDPADLVCKGDRVRARVLSVSSKKRRLALSLRSLEQPELQDVEREVPLLR